MSTEVKIIADSISPAGKRIITLQATYPRMIHGELLTHRVLSRNASSTRAIPTAKLAERGESERVYPVLWGKNQPGMQAKDEELSPDDVIKAHEIWDRMADACVKGARELAELGLHKQWAGRPLEWFSTISVVITSTEWDNFFALRAHPDAQPEIRTVAEAMAEAMVKSVPNLMLMGDWHLPYVSSDELSKLGVENAIKCSAARCARVSYMKHDGSKPSVEDDLELYNQLATRPHLDKRGHMWGADAPVHLSPLEHQATPLTKVDMHSGNFVGWRQYRKMIEPKPAP